MGNAVQRRSRKYLKALAIGAVASLGLTACAGGGGEENEGQTLVFGLSSEPGNPITGQSQGTAMNQLMALVHRGLMSYSEDGTLVPGVAESVEEPDATTFVFTIREGLTFHDDSPLTPEDVKASVDYFRDAANGSTVAEGLADISEVTVDGQNVTLTLEQPNSALLQYLALPFAGIVPQASLNSETPNWIGAGPFEMTDMQEGIGLTMVKDDEYYDAANVSLDEIDVRFLADNEARTNALLTGEVDMIEYLPWENFDRVESAGYTIAAESGPFQYVQFNVTEGPFADPLVRQAVAYALNRDNSVTAAFQDNATPLAGIAVAEDDAAYDENLANLWEYDPEHAKELLAEAGYPDGFSATLLSTSQYTFLQDNALSVQEDLREIGIDVTLDAPDWPTRITKGNEGDYDLAVSGDTGIVPDPSYLLRWVVDAGTYNVGWGYENDEIRDLIEQGLRATSDEEKHAIYQQVGELWAEDVPMATLNQRDQAYAYNADVVSGFQPLPDTMVFFSGYNLANITVAE